MYTLLYIEKKQKQEEGNGSASTVCHLPSSYSSSYHPSGCDEGKSKGANRTGRERTSAKDAADLFARSSPLLLLRLMSSPSTPSPAAHLLARLCQHSGRGTGGHLVRFWSMQSPPHRHHLATDRPATSNHRASPRSVCHPSCLVLFPSSRW